MTFVPTHAASHAQDCFRKCRTLICCQLGFDIPEDKSSTVEVGRVRFRKRFRMKAPLDRRTVELVAETEAFLSGDILAVLQQKGRTIPNWARLNAFAHGDIRLIREFQNSSVAQLEPWSGWDLEAWPAAVSLQTSWYVDADMEAWRRAERVIAEELLELVDGEHERLSRLQQRALVPLELRLLTSDEGWPLRPEEFVQCMQSALRSIPS